MLFAERMEWKAKYFFFLINQNYLKIINYLKYYNNIHLFFKQTSLQGSYRRCWVSWIRPLQCSREPTLPTILFDSSVLGWLDRVHDHWVCSLSSKRITSCSYWSDLSQWSIAQHNQTTRRGILLSFVNYIYLLFEYIYPTMWQCWPQLAYSHVTLRPLFHTIMIMHLDEVIGEQNALKSLDELRHEITGWLAISSGD